MTSGDAWQGGTGCFLAECWQLQPDAITFGKVSNP